MKSYKEFGKMYIGASDKACLTVKNYIEKIYEDWSLAEKKAKENAETSTKLMVDKINHPWNSELAGAVSDGEVNAWNYALNFICNAKADLAVILEMLEEVK